jgi:hypothetical protein
MGCIQIVHVQDVQYLGPLSPRPIRECQRVHTPEGTHIPDTSTASEIQRVHTSESTDIPDIPTVNEIQRVYASESTDISDTLTVT